MIRRLCKLALVLGLAALLLRLLFPNKQCERDNWPLL